MAKPETASSVLLGADGNPLQRSVSRSSGFGGSSAYVAGDSNVETMASFHPSSRAADADILPARDKISARARHLVANNGWAAGGVAKEVDSIIGANFRPFCKPDWKALGLSAEWATDFKMQVEARWRAYADDPRKMADVTRAQTVPQMFGLAYRTYCVEGEALGIVSWKSRRSTRTTLRVVDPDLLSNPRDMPNSERLRAGIGLTKDGAARDYHFRQGHQNSAWTGMSDYRWKRIARENRNGRPQVLHFFDKTRDGQTRGVSRLAPIIEKLKMEDQYSKVELQAAVINAVLAAFIKSPLGPDAIDEMFGEGGGSALMNMQQDRSEFYSERGGVHIGGAKLTALYPNDEIGMVKTARPAAQFADFETAILRNIASGLGISYEQLASDWSKVNYSSARAALIEIWRSWTARRLSFGQGFCQLYFMAWLEEQVMDGHITLPRGAPDFYQNWSSYARAKWIGPGKGFVDPVKEVQASAMRVALGLSTLEEEAAELTGSDWSENIDQIKHEITLMPSDALHPMQENFAKLLGPGLIQAQSAGV